MNLQHAMACVTCAVISTILVIYNDTVSSSDVTLITAGYLSRITFVE